jgi:hypothetical protein
MHKVMVLLGMAAALAVLVIGLDSKSAYADWNIGDRLYSASNCSSAPKDPVNITYRVNGWLGNALTHFDHHLNWVYIEGSTLHFVDHGACTPHDAQRANGPNTSSRDHTRFEDGDSDPTQGTWTAGAAHHDELCIPEGHVGDFFNVTRDTIKTAFSNGGHSTLLFQSFSAGSIWLVCGGSGWWESWDGKVAWIDITTG